MVHTAKVATWRRSFGNKVLQAASEDTLLWRAGRVESTHNLPKYVLERALDAICRR